MVCFALLISVAARECSFVGGRPTITVYPQDDLASLAVASHAIHILRFPVYPWETPCETPASFISSGDWQLVGLSVPPKHMRYDWAQSLSYARLSRSCCALVCCRSSSLASGMRLAAPCPQLPLPLYADPAAAALHFPRLTHAQQQLLLCTASHAGHFVRVTMARDARYHRDPRKQLLLCLHSEAVVQRLLQMSFQGK